MPVIVIAATAAGRPPLAVTLFGALGGVVLAALLFLMVCVACVAVLALLHAVLPTGPSEEEVPGEAGSGELTTEGGGAEDPTARDP